MGLMSVSLFLRLSVSPFLRSSRSILHLEFEFYTLVDKSMYCIYLYCMDTILRTRTK
jgi:hypothetical protein